MNDEDKHMDVRLSEPTYVLASQYPPGWEEPDDVSLADYILVLWRHRMLILAGTFSCALIAFLVSQMLPRVYEAKATLILQPPSFSTELKPQPLSVETYQPIAESGHVLELTKQKMVAEGFLNEGDTLGDTRTEIYPSKVQELGYQPILELIVGFGDPRKAAAIANGWAEILVQESTGLLTEGKQGTLEFIQNEYPATKERLTLSEKELKETQDKYDRQTKERRDYWDSRIADFKTEWNLAYLRREFGALQSRLTADFIRLNDLDVRIKESGDRLENLRAELKQHTQFLVVSKAITDDALWDQTAGEAAGDRASQLQELKLRTEELNPVYQELQQQIAEAQVLYSTLLPQKEHLEEKVSAEREKVKDLNHLILQKETELRKLERTRDTQLIMLEREQDYKVAQLTREIDSSQETFKLLAKAYESARLAQTEADQDLKIGARAVPPLISVSPRPLLNTAIALVVGLMLSTMLAFVVEYVQTSSTAGARQR